MTGCEGNSVSRLKRLAGLIAATYTPLDSGGSFNAARVGDLVDYLIDAGVSGLYVCGSTGEGMSLSSDERKAVLEAFVKANNGRVPVIAQVGHNSLAEARQLAAHAQQSGADAISATCPSYFKVPDNETLVACMAELAAGATKLPFYYYHIPALTGSTLDILEFLELGCSTIPSLVGLKYTDTKLHEFQQCLEFDAGRVDVVWGCDEMLLGALATGARAAIGSTYNIAAPLYRAIFQAFETSDFVEARRLQSQSVNMISTMMHFPFHPAMKAVLSMLGMDVGGCRLPQRRLTEDEIAALRCDLEKIGFFDWCRAR
jgi:N-acetylneuraminate lyase